MANDGNLIPQAHTLTTEENRRGGIKSGEARKRKKTMRELAAFIGSLPAKQLKKEDLGQLPDDEEIDIDRHLEFMLKVNEVAMTGNVKAMKLWLDMIDDLDKKKKELEIEKLQAEIEEMKGGGKDKQLPTFTFNFTDCSMPDGGKK